MEKISLQQKLNPNFIGSWLMQPLSISDELVHYFEANANKHTRGVTGAGANLDAKDSTDIKITPKEIKLPGNEVFENYFHALLRCYQNYVLGWPFLESFPKNLHIGSFNLQRYTSGQHFQEVHTERGSLATLHRVFAWMTYLNDVNKEDGGSTYFSHYDLEIQPRRGLTLIWPSEWTHAHKGNIIEKGDKYIITGWLHFPK